MERDQEIRNEAIKAILDKYREIDQKGSYANGLEIAVSLFGQDEVDRYLQELYTNQNERK